MPMAPRCALVIEVLTLVIIPLIIGASFHCCD
jgi:hypothetical protein